MKDQPAAPVNGALATRAEEKRRHGQIGDEEGQPGQALLGNPAQPAGAVAEEQHAEEGENEPEDIAHDRCGEGPCGETLRERACPVAATCGCLSVSPNPVNCGGAAGPARI